MKRVALLAYPLGTDYGVHEVPRRSLLRAYRRALLEKSNPRSPEYMRKLAEERLRDTPVEVAVPPDTEEVVLLYPDAIGLGFAAKPPGMRRYFVHQPASNSQRGAAAHTACR